MSFWSVGVACHREPENLNLVMNFDVDDIIKNYQDNDDDDNADGDLDLANLNVDDLLNEDLTSSVLQSNDSPINPITSIIGNQSQQQQPQSSVSPTNSANNNNNQANKPQLSSTLPPPIAPKADESNIPDLPSTPSHRYSLSSATTNKAPNITTEAELDIEKILQEDQEEDELGLTSGGNDPLLDFDPTLIDLGIVCYDIL